MPQKILAIFKNKVALLPDTHLLKISVFSGYPLIKKPFKHLFSISFKYPSLLLHSINMDKYLQIIAYCQCRMHAVGAFNNAELFWLNPHNLPKSHSPAVKYTVTKRLSAFNPCMTS